MSTGYSNRDIAAILQRIDEYKSMVRALERRCIEDEEYIRELVTTLRDELGYPQADRLIQRAKHFALDNAAKRLSIECGTKDQT